MAVLMFGRRCEEQRPQERTYSKADVMAALSKCEAPAFGDGGDGIANALFDEGARAMATALLEGSSADDVRKAKDEGIAKIMLGALVEMAKRGMKNEIGGV